MSCILIFEQYLAIIRESYRLTTKIITKVNENIKIKYVQLLVYCVKYQEPYKIFLLYIGFLADNNEEDIRNIVIFIEI